MIPDWFPDLPPVYDITKSYAENAAEGPYFDAKIPRREKKKSVDFLGFEVHSPIGVPAGPLLNSRWIALAASLGFDIPTYKTIRSAAHSGHSLPNVIYVERTGDHRARALSDAPNSLSDLTITNSFGMPSKSPEFLMEDIEKANRSLHTGQVMIISVVGSLDQGRSFVDDFIHTALFAKDAGAKIIEVNFSCPNVDKKEGSLYTSSDAVFEFTRKISQALGSTPLLIKVGHFNNREQMQHILVAAARGGARGVCGLNSVSMEVVDAKGHPALGEDRKTSGICGGAIRAMACHFIRDAAKIIGEQKLGLTLLGCGGIMRAEHFDDFLEAGAQVAMSATGFMWDPYLAMRYHHAQTVSHS